MEGSQHPEGSDTSVLATGAHDPFVEGQATELAAESASIENPRAEKRQHEDSGDDASAKRAHLSDPSIADVNIVETDELDLDALMAQLQQHTERAQLQSIGDGDSNSEAVSSLARSEPELKRQSLAPSGAKDRDTEPTTETQPTETRREKAVATDTPLPDEAGTHKGGVNSDSESRDPETELSIEQQLKGALSSLQEFGADSDDEDEDLGLGLSQLSQLPTLTQILQPQLSQEESPERSDTEAGEDARARARDTEQAGPTGERVVEKPGPNYGAPTEQRTDASTRLQSLDVQSSSAQMAQDDQASPVMPRGTVLKEAPTHLGDLPPLPPPGQLPPMPPPPVAFTSPTAPLTAEERARALGLRQMTRSPHEGSAQPASAASATKTATAAQLPPPRLSEEYEKSIARQVDEAKKAALETVPPPLLSNNQTILLARRRSIILLDSLSAQVLEALSCNHYQETLATVTQPQSERGMAYRILLDAFEDAKRIFMPVASPSSRVKPEAKPEEARPFLSYNISGVDHTRENAITVQRANLATFVAAVFGTVEIGFWELDKWFIPTFVPENGRLLKQQANIYLDLKTQAYISAVEGTSDKEVHKAALEDLFPANLEDTLQHMFGERVTLAPSEKDFVEKCQRRRENIEAEQEKDLASKYHWVPFLREVSDYIQRNHYTLLPPRQNSFAAGEQISSQAESAPARSAPLTRRQAPAPSTRVSTAVPSTRRGSELRAPAVPAASQAAKQPLVGDKEEKSTPAGQSSNVEAGPSGSQDGPGKKQPDFSSSGHPLFPPLPKQVIPPPSLSSSEPDRVRRPGPRAHHSIQHPVQIGDGPTDTLAAYEAARATAEGTDAIRPKASMFTTRRSWTKEEEEALLKGMDRVQGPYWAQILELYGPGGKISEVLKDRSQVQLKDKARNLKMFFVRLGLPIPAVFQYVTGDYETRKSSGKKKQQAAAAAARNAPMQSTATISPQGSTTAPTKVESSVSRLPPQAAQQGPERQPASEAPPTTAHPQATIHGTHATDMDMSRLAGGNNSTSGNQNQALSVRENENRPESSANAPDQNEVQAPESSGKGTHSDESSSNAQETPAAVRIDKTPGTGTDLSSDVPIQTTPGAGEKQALDSKAKANSEAHKDASDDNNESSLPEAFGSGADKDDDLHSLLSRVGDLVNHY